MKVLLVKPHYNVVESASAYSSAVFPIGLLSLATYLKKRNYEPIIIDATIDDNYLDKISLHIKDSLAVGITSMSAQVHSSVKIAEFIKARNSEIPIIWGGVHPSLYPSDTVRSPLVDAVVRGEGEETFFELLQSLKHKKNFHGIKGVTFKEGETVISTPDRPLLTDIPVLDYDLLPEIEKYAWADLHPFKKEKTRCFDVHAGRGCIYKCTFCFENMTLQHRSKNAEVLVSEISQLKTKYNIEMVNIQDSDFFSDKVRLLRFIDLMIDADLGVKWFSNCRSNYFNHNYIDENLLNKLEASGCIKLGIGAESGSDAMLAIMKKCTDVKQLKNAIIMLNNTKIWLSLSFIVGMPDESEEDMKKTLKFILEIIEESRRHYIIGPAYFRPYPGCEMFRRAMDFGFCPPKTLAEWADSAKERFGYLPMDKFNWVSNKKLARYIMDIVDFRHFKNHKHFIFLYSIFRKIIELRLKNDFWCCLWEDKALLLIRVILTFLRNRAVLIRV